MAHRHGCGQSMVAFGVVITLTWLCYSVESVYLNKWAVYVNGGPSEADRIATTHGFKNLGQIGSLKGYYLFEHRHVEKRSTRASLHHHTKLEQESTVLWAEQQKARKRVKRDFSDPDSTKLKYRSGAWKPYWNDPMWSQMWYMNGRNEHDMNIIGAWEMGYTGKGVVVTILDDGIEHTHADLIQNYDPEASVDINDGDDDPLPRYDSRDENKHGTRCAGEVAASANNTKCVVGVAYDAKIGGVRMLDGDVSDFVEAQALSLHPQHIDIYSASWGPDDSGRVVDGPAKLAKEAFVQGVLEGRGGKGSVYVWASGNGGSNADSCSCDGYTNSIFTLSVSSTSENNVKPWYLEECASTLATTYSSGDNYRERKVHTTDLHGNCTSSHTGTSASAPMAAAMCALALQANPDLTWRDMQHIVMLTSDPSPLIDGEWVENSRGRFVSHKYGFGLMNGRALVEIAERWSTVPQQHICPSDLHNIDQRIEGRGMNLTLDTSGCADTVNEIRYLEHVQAKVTLDYRQRGDIRLNLYSPAGTKSTLLPRRKNDVDWGEFRDWPFMTVFNWGENPVGTWRLEVETSGSLRNTGVFYQWQLILYGTYSDPIQLHDPPQHRPPPGGIAHQREEDSDNEVDSEELGSHGNTDYTEYEINLPDEGKDSETGGDAIWITPDEGVVSYVCHEQCSYEGCRGPDAEDCLYCLNARLMPGGPCVESCPVGAFIDMNTGVCESCPHPCDSCTGPDTSSDCTMCHPAYYLLVELGRCDVECPRGFYTDHMQKLCIKCHESCDTCYEDPYWCSECPLGHDLLDSTHLCVPHCPPAQYRNAHFVCEPCLPGCQSCVGPRLTDCIACLEGFVSQDHVCRANCSVGYHLAEDGSQCLRCSPTCETCSGPSELDCVVCQHPLVLSVNGICHERCPYGEFTDTESRSCQACHHLCSTCSGPSLSQCLSCNSERYLIEGRCVSECPMDHYRMATTYQDSLGMTFLMRKCMPCHPSCQSCIGGGALECLSCVKGLLYSDGECLVDCMTGEFMYEDQCLLCHNACLSCTGPHSNDCVSCYDDTYLHHGQCLSECHTGYFTLGNECHRCDPRCYSCVARGEENCESCSEGYIMVDNVCVEASVSACLPHQFFSEADMSCHECDRSCETCSGGGTHHCLTCNHPRLYHSNTRRCMLCCDDMEGLLHKEIECCICDKTNISTNECSDYRLYSYTSTAPPRVQPTQQTTEAVPSSDTSIVITSSAETAHVTSASSPSQRTPDLISHPQITSQPPDISHQSSPSTPYSTVSTSPPPSSETSKTWTRVMTIIVCLCLLTTLAFCVVFGLMQAKAHDRLCWRYKYQPVPIHYQNGKNRLVKVVNQNGYHDEDHGRDDIEAYTKA